MEDQGKKTLFRIIYNTSGKKLVPKDFEKCWMTQIPKKRNPRKCEDHRIISWRIHALKILTKIIHRRIFFSLSFYSPFRAFVASTISCHRRIKAKINDNLEKDQFGIWRIGTRIGEVILQGLKMIMEKMCRVNKSMYLAFVA